MRRHHGLLIVGLILASAALLGAPAQGGAEETNPRYDTIREPGGVATTSPYLPYEYYGSPGTSTEGQAAHMRPGVGDFNGDGRNDVCLPQITGAFDEEDEWLVEIHGPLLIAYGDGMGGVDESCGVEGFQQIASDCPPGVLAYGDLNEDGCTDIVTARTQGDIFDMSNASTKLIIWYGKEDCTFTEAVADEIRALPNAVRVFDADNDHHLDLFVLVVTTENLTEAWMLRGDGDGTFDDPIRSVQEPGFLTAGANVDIGDLNGDGVLDVVLASVLGSDTPEFWLVAAYGDGAGGFAFAPYDRISYWPGVTAVGDINGDGLDDACVLHFFEEVIDEETGARGFLELPALRVSVYLGSMTDVFEPVVTYYLKMMPRYVYLRDVNLDGHADAVLVDSKGIVLVMEGAQDGALGTPSAYSAANGSHSRCWSGGLGDLNHDGVTDLFVQLFEQELVVRFGNGAGGFGTRWMSPPISTNLPVYAEKLAGPADFDQDGRLDLVFLEGEGAGIAYGDGTGSFDEMAVLLQEYGWSCAAVGDFNGDGRNDVLFGTQYLHDEERMLRLFLNQGKRVFIQAPGSAIPPKMATGTTSSLDHCVNELLVGDVDEDGVDDVVVCEWDETYVLQGTSGRYFSRGESLSLSNERMSPEVEGRGGIRLYAPQLVDINADRHLDLVGVDTMSSQERAIVWLGDGAGEFADIAEYSYRQLFGWPSDLDNDGYPDLLGLTAWHGEPGYHALLGSIDGEFRIATLDIAPWMGVTSQMVGDLDGDGNVDFAEAWGSVLWVYLGDCDRGRGERLQFAPHAWGAFSHDLDTLPGDFDGDGRPDIALPSQYQISIILNWFPADEERE